MSIRRVHKQAKYGEELTTLAGQGERAIGTLQTLRSRLPALRTAIQNDPDLAQAEKDSAVGEVDATIVNLVGDIKTFANGL